jgi:dTMP kinase
MNSTLLDRIESEPIEFYDKVRNGYLSIAQKTPSMWIILDASKSPSDINSQIWEYLR